MWGLRGARYESGLDVGMHACMHLRPALASLLPVQVQLDPCLLILTTQYSVANSGLQRLLTT